MKFNSITTKIIVSSTVPIFLALIGLAIYNYYNSQRLQNEAYNEKREIINKEIQHIFDLQDVAIGSIETKLSTQMEAWSHTLINKYLDSMYTPLEAPLEKIRLELGMDPTTTDIYIINRQGIIINTTFQPDYMLNLFGFGPDHKNFIMRVFDSGQFTSEPFTTEASTKKIKKYSYQATLDRNYIVEIGSYSNDAHDLITSMRKTFANIAKDQKGYRSVDLFIIADNPFSFTTQDTLSPLEQKIVKSVETSNDTIRTRDEDGVRVYYDYSKLNRKFTALYKGAVVRLIYDKSELEAKNRSELIFSVFIFSMVTIIVALLIFFEAKRLSKPLKTLADKANFIAQGNFQQHIHVTGSYEIARLSESFDSMVDQLRDSLNNLEMKVEERTKELAQKSEEIEIQKNSLVSKNKRIESSLNYAYTIQLAILPTAKMLQSLGDYFKIYLPKDKVSGDSYWISSMQESDKKVFFFAIIDCTGHGVPGAFMTLIADRLLNSIIIDQKTHSPADILEKLDAGVRKMLRQEQNTNDDGMDIGLAKIELYRNGDKTLTFAGAKRPIYVFRDESEKLEILKGSIRSIGGNRYGLEEPFKNYKIELIKNDIAYFFTDGIIDQKNNEFGKKKFGTKGLVQFINDNARHNLAKQHEILDAILAPYLENENQMDDITLIAFRF